MLACDTGIELAEMRGAAAVKIMPVVYGTMTFIIASRTIEPLATESPTQQHTFTYLSLID